MRRFRLAIRALSGALVGLALVSTQAWAQCGSPSFSPLPCSSVPVALPFTLGWSASHGGINATSGGTVGTGFTVVAPHSNNFDPVTPTQPQTGYEPSMLQVQTSGSGLLKITTSRGIMYRDPAQSANTNSLVNGLGVGVNLSTTAVKVETTMPTVPAATNLAEQQGLWIWLDEDNLVKLAMISTGGTSYKFQLQVEDYPPTAAGFPAVTGAPLEINTAGFNMTGVTPKITLIADGSPPSFTGYYDIGAGPVLIGSFPQAANAAGATSTCSGGVCPAPGAEFFTGLDHDASGATPNVTFVGLFATQRNNTTVSPRLVYNFDSFTIATYCTSAADCNDGNVCNGTETCSANTCVAGSALTCNDGNVCTTDSCIPATGCSFVSNTNPCDDLNACTTGDVCGGGGSGICGGAPVTCNDGNVCTTDSCNPGSGCQFVNNTNGCDDGNACTSGDICGGGTCGGAPITCNDGNVCTTDTCIPASGCQFANNTNGCDDGNACTSGDVCGGGTCGGSPISCDDANDCTDDSCVPSTGCAYTNNTDLCDDGNVCTMGDVCADGVCEPGENLCPFGCEPGNTVNIGTQTKSTKAKRNLSKPDADAFQTQGAFVSAMPLDLGTSEITVGMTDGAGTYYEGTLAAGAFVTKNGKTFKYADKTKPYENDGLQSAKFSIKSDGQTYQYKFGAKGLNLGALPVPPGGILAVKVGDRCFVDNAHTCVISSSGTSAKCQ